ncbi:cysteine desulfurase family protein [Afifella sp. YEN Y35]|uniref:cysteine desulfurase family protein n=1 Tax=Afifella sp. YEN Y35 TaxID=3388337 RepID=UPI0039E19F54
MSRARTYLDANATEPLRPQAREAMLAALEHPGNASSVHGEGRWARDLIEGAREAVAALLGAKAANVVFTSGATEAANWALTPMAPDERLYLSAVEHPCVLAGGMFAPDRTDSVPVRGDGVLDIEALRARLAADATESRPVLALMAVNNETGVVQPVAEAAAAVHEFGGRMICDAVQAAGRMPLSLEELGADTLFLSSHKLGGPQGAGALVVRSDEAFPKNLLKGGGQEKRRRAGTENLAAIAGFGVAVQEVRHHVSHMERLQELRQRLEQGLRKIEARTLIAGEAAERVANTVLFATPGMAAETLVIAFDLEGVSVSSGSACSSGKVGDSHVLRAMNFAAPSAIRVSLPWNADERDIDRFLDVWQTIHHRMNLGRAA